jgi:hypothetical protein
MKIQKPGFLKSCGYIGIIASVLLIMSLVVAGCTQTSTDNSGQSTSAVSPTDAYGNSIPAQGAGSAAPAGTSPQGQHTGGNFLTNTTRLAAAAQTLGVSESDLQTALTPAQGARVNLTDAAAQLSASSGTSITPAQLMAALGMHAGGMRNSSYQRNGQTAAGNGGNTQSGYTSSGTTASGP